MAAEAPRRVPVDRLAAFITRALQAGGLPPEDAATVGGLMAEADLQGSDGHGVIRLAPYLKRLRAGGLNTRPDIRIVSERPAMALLDGDNGMGHLVMSKAARIAIDKARACGIGWVGARHSNHAGPASLYLREPLREGMVALYFAVGNANHLPPWGGMDMLLSTNPVAVGIPAGSEPPVVLDMATTVAAYGKVKAKAKRGEMMPEGWMIDREGKPLLDPKRSEEGFLTPIGGYKGYGLSLVVGLLAGTLNGAAMGKAVIDFNKDSHSVSNTGQAIAVIDPAAFGDPQGFKQRVDEIVQEMRSSERMPGVERIWVPGEQSQAKRVQYAQQGIPIPPTLMQQLDTLALELKVPALRDTVA